MIIRVAKIVLLCVISGLFLSCASTEEWAKSKGASTKPYPLATCLVSGEDLDSMGGAVTEVYHGQEVKFCCESCSKDFHREPQKYLNRL